MSQIIAVQDLRKVYRSVRRPRGGAITRLKRLFAPEYQLREAVAGVTFAVSEGERVAIIGPNGAGKSTTLKMLSGVLEPSSGDAAVLGLTPWRQRRALAFGIGVVLANGRSCGRSCPRGTRLSCCAESMIKMPTFSAAGSVN